MKRISTICCFFHYLRDRFFFVNSISILLISIHLSHQSFSQITLQFPNGAGNGVLVSGTAGTVGAIYEWPNVGTDGAITIKGRIEILAVTGGATLTTIDGASTAADWEPQIAGPSTTAGNSWGIKFQVRFYNAATSAAYTMSSFRVQAIDIDGGGTGSPLREYNTFQPPNSYTLETPTELTVTTEADGVRFTSSASAYSGISIAQTQYIASCDYTNVNSFNITCGVSASGGTVSATNRLHSVNFRNVVVFTDPVVLPVELISFTGKVIDHNRVRVDWTTASENNNDFFTLEQMDTTDEYCDLSIINGAGTDQNENYYYFVDEHPLFNSIIYYRLKQTDYDGAFTYSYPITVDNRVYKKEISMKTNVLGQEVNDMYRGVVILVFDDGTTVKIVQ